MKLKLAFDEECYAKETTYQEKTNWLLLAIIVITVVVIAVIVTVILVIRWKRKPKATIQSGISTSTNRSSPQYPKGSISKNIRSKDESTATTTTSVKSGDKAKSNALKKTSGKEGIKSVSPSKKSSVSPQTQRT